LLTIGITDDPSGGADASDGDAGSSAIGSGSREKEMECD